MGDREGWAKLSMWEDEMEDKKLIRNAELASLSAYRQWPIPRLGSHRTPFISVLTLRPSSIQGGKQSSGKSSKVHCFVRGRLEMHLVRGERSHTAASTEDRAIGQVARYLVGKGTVGFGEGQY